MTASKEAKRTPVPMNGVDTPALFARINAVGVQPELAKRCGVSMRSLASAFSTRLIHDRDREVAELWRHINRVEAPGKAQANWLGTI